MHEVTYQFDDATKALMRDLCSHYKVSEEEVIKKCLSLGRVAAFVEQTNGEIIVRKGTHETVLLI